MTWRDISDDSELLNLEQAAAEGATTPDDLGRFMYALHQGTEYWTQPRPRLFWSDLLLIEPIFRLYIAVNHAAHHEYLIADRAEAIFFRLSDFADDKWNVGLEKRRKERLLSVRKRLSSLISTDGDTPSQIRLNAIIERIPRTLLVEISEAREASCQVSRSQSNGMSRAEIVADFFAAIDQVLKRSSKRGPKANRHAKDLHARMKDDYLWLTGRRKADWSNATGLHGGFIDFQRKLLVAVGITAPSEYLLRARSK